jgi:hypothetical protein
MESSTVPDVLVVACQTAKSPDLLAAVRARAADGPCTFTLLVPTPTHGLHRLMDPEDADPAGAQTVIDDALPGFREAAGGAPVTAAIGDPTPLSAIADAVNAGHFDEIIISTLPTHLSKWLHLDLPHKAAGLGLPVTTVTPASA